MKKLLPALLVLSALGVGLSRAGANDDDVIGFNDRLVERLKASQVPFEAYWDALAPWYAGERLEREPVTQAFSTVRKTHQRIYGELLEVQVPDKELCRDFYEAVVEYLTIDREIIAAYDATHQYVFENNPAARRRDIAYVEGVINPVLARQEAVLERLALLQEKLAEAHGFQLRNLERIAVAAAEEE